MDQIVTVDGKLAPMRRRTIIYVAAIAVGILVVSAAGVGLAYLTDNPTAVAQAQQSPSASTSDRGMVTGVMPSASPSPNCGGLAFDKPAAATLRSSRKKAFAYYFPPFPISIENKAPSSDYYKKWQFTGDHRGQYDLRDRPIGRPVKSGDWRKQDFQTEVRQAIAMGLDGFIWEYHTHSADQRWNQLPAMLAAVKAVDSGFKIMLSPDLVKGAESTPDGIIRDVLQVRNESALLRVDGAIVLAPFYPERKPASWWDGVRSSLTTQGVKTSLVPIFLDGSPDRRAPEWNKSVIGYSNWGFNWASSSGSIARDAKQARAKDRIYLAPAVFEDTRTNTGQFWESGNSATLRSNFEKAIEGDADWVYFRTWNDYTESWMAPSAQRGTTVGDVAAYYITWFKTGKRPALARDALYYFHRSHHTSLSYDHAKQVKPMKLVMGDPVANDVELLAFVSAPSTLVITQGSAVATKEVTAPGVVSFKVPIKGGTTPEFQLQRVGVAVITIRSAIAVKTSITLQDWIYHGGGGTACR